MRGQAKVKPQARLTPVAEQTGNSQTGPAALIQLTDSIRSIAKSKQRSKEMKALLQSLRDALLELRHTLAENHRLRDDLANATANTVSHPFVHAHIDASLAVLTIREREVLRLIAAGYSTKQVAAELDIAFKTAVTHRTRLMSKLDLHETASLTRYAIRHRLVQP